MFTLLSLVPLGEVDYLENSAPLMFGFGDTRVCFNITIVDDDHLEVLEETFILSTSDDDVYSLTPRITVDPDSALITIIDDDSK